MSPHVASQGQPPSPCPQPPPPALCAPAVRCLRHRRRSHRLARPAPPCGIEDDPPPRKIRPAKPGQRPRSNIPPPKQIRINSAGRPSNKLRKTPIPPPPPPPVSKDPITLALTRLIRSMPGFRDISPEGFKAPPEPKWKRPLDYGDWAADIELGDAWDYRPGASFSRRRPDTRERYANTSTPRDSYLRPIADRIGVLDRLSPNQFSRELRLAEEATLNRRESRKAVIFAGIWLFLLPVSLGFFVSRGIAEPAIAFIQETNPERLQLTSKMKIEGATHIKEKALSLRLEANLGKAPPLSNEELFHELQHAAHEYAEEKHEEIRQGMVNFISDSITLSTFLAVLVMHNEGRRDLRNTIGRVSQGMSTTGKAFILIFAADVLMGYHSEEGWRAAIELLSEHYGVEVGFAPVAIFVSTVPVLLDTLFKWWLFRGLNRIDPSASVTLSELDRH